MNVKRFLSLIMLSAGIIITAADKHKIVFVSGNPSHGKGAHEHKGGNTILMKGLNESGLNIEAVETHYGYPKDSKIFDGAKTIVVYCDGGKRHLLNNHLDEFDGIMKKGVGLVCLHYAVETTKGKNADKFLEWIGGTFEIHWSVNPHWTANFKEFPDHPIANGVKPFSVKDEWYFHMRFVEGMKGVTPILSDVPPASTMKRKDGAHSGNPHVRKAVEKGEKQHVGWAYQRKDGGRGFGFTGGHFHKNWQNDEFRKVVLNAIVWTANIDVPKDGVKSKTPTTEELNAVMDK